jgi:hypothetical protein
LVDPCPSADVEHVDLSITMLPFTGTAKDLAGLSVTLQHSIQTDQKYQGHLNYRGQVLFKNLAKGSYQVHITPTPAQLWQQRVTTALSPIAELLTDIQVAVGQQLTVFRPTQLLLTPQWIGSVHNYESRGPDESVQRLSVPVPTEDYVIALTIKPGSNGRTTLIVQVTEYPLGQPIKRVRVTHRDKAGFLLTSELTQDDGSVTFAQIPPGSYQIEVKYKEKTWLLPITFQEDREPLED